MNKIIIYGSQYGTTKKYAEELSRRTGIALISYQHMKSINQYDLIIYLGALYAGGVLGMSKTLKRISDVSNKKVIIITVGLADPSNSENINTIRNSIKRQISNEILSRTEIYHLRGRINYSKLKFIHKAMMSMVYEKDRRVLEEEKTAEMKAMIETYNKKVDFVQFDRLDIIEEKINTISLSNEKDKVLVGR